ncbi:hypothetical protein EB796_018000 [Bugula neritina]|uniref:Zasp-like motif domain-containing protein n=1 Tax=Bugula neritina TaxID=10212 RepID=A0A7J7JDH2_BUGNE|nr:hypothetical protein EB796_018000 [Bugula neritina]
MYSQNGGYTVGSHYWNDTPQGSMLTPQDQAMLNLVSHSLASKPLRPANSPPQHQQRESHNNFRTCKYFPQHKGRTVNQTTNITMAGTSSRIWASQGRKFYQPHNFNKPTPGPLSYKPSHNPYSSTASAAHLQYNSPLQLYSKKNAQNALNISVPGDSSAGQTIKLSAYQGGEAKGDIVDSPTLRYVLREDEVKAKTGHKADVQFYREAHEYGPGMVPLKAYKEEVDEPIPSSDF